MSDDRFLEDHRRTPRAGFVRALRERLREQDADTAAARDRRLHPALAAVLGVAVLAAAFSLPAVRATAQDMLDLFRVRTFTPVAFDPERLERLRTLAEREGGDGPMLFLERTEMVERPGEPVTYATPEEAAAQAGIEVFEPETLPRGIRLEQVEVAGASTSRFTLDTDGLSDALEVLGLSDVTVPAAIDGQTMTVHTAKRVRMQYRSERHRAALMQAESPQVTLPSGVELAQLGEIALRVLGMDAREARRVAASIDWTSSLIIPLPTTATSFRELTIGGARGLLVTRREEGQRHEGHMLLWARDGRVYGLTGNLGEQDMVMMAESVR
jgi:hypothetical protein